MGYVKLICFCIWAIQAIEKLRDKKVTGKPSGKILSGITAIFIILQFGSGIALSVYGSLLEALQSNLLFPIPTVWWIGILPIVSSILGFVVVYQRKRKRIVIWIIVNFALCLGNGIIMSYTDCFTPNKFGVSAESLNQCKHPGLSTTASPTTTTSVHLQYMNSDGSLSYDDSNDSDEVKHLPKLPCDMVFRIDALLDGLTYSLLTYCGLVVMVTILASVIGCCLQECVADEGLEGPTFVPVDQMIDGRDPQYNPYSTHDGQVFSSIGAPVGYVQPSHPGPGQQWSAQYPGHNDGFQMDSDRAMLV